MAHSIGLVSKQGATTGSVAAGLAASVFGVPDDAASSTTLGYEQSHIDGLVASWSNNLSGGGVFGWMLPPTHDYLQTEEFCRSELGRPMLLANPVRHRCLCLTPRDGDGWQRRAAHGHAVLMTHAVRHVS